MTDNYAVLRSNDMLFLGLLRSFAASGVAARPITYTWPGAGPWWSESSVFFRSPIEVPNPFEDADGAASQLIRGLRDVPDPLVLPSSDTGLMFLIDHEALLRPHLRLVGDREFANFRPDVADKGVCARLLEEAGVAIPTTVAVRSEDDISEAVRRIRGPAVVKPAVKDYGQTFYRINGGSKAIHCDTESALRDALQSMLAHGFDLVAQEKIEFESAQDEVPGYIYLDAAGETRAFVGAIKERIDPPPFGTATILRLVHADHLRAKCEQVGRALRWRGMLMVEFIQDRKDGQWKVIEVNGRPWLMLDFFRRSGVDFVGALVADRLGISQNRQEAQTLPAGIDPVHFDLVGIANGEREQRRPVSSASLKDLMNAVPGTHKSLPFLMPGDSEPGIRRLSALAESCGERPLAILRAVEPLLGEVK